MEKVHTEGCEPGGSMESIKKRRKKENLSPSAVLGLFGARCNRQRHTFSSPGSVTFLSPDVGVGVTKQKWVDDRVSGARSKMWLLLAGR